MGNFLFHHEKKIKHVHIFISPINAGIYICIQNIAGLGYHLVCFKLWDPYLFIPRDIAKINYAL